MQVYQELVDHVLTEGQPRPNRTGIPTTSLFNANYEVDLRHGFPLLTTKRVSWKNIVCENLWFLSGEKSLDFLHANNIHFWDPWATHQNEIPSAYGNLWRYPFDQIDAMLTTLAQDPYTRRAIVTPWQPEQAYGSALPPCHCMFQLNVQDLADYPINRDNPYHWLEPNWHAAAEHESKTHREVLVIHDPFANRAGIVHPEHGLAIYDGEKTPDTKPHLNLHLTQRSADIGLGVPYNLAGYAFLLELFGQFLQMPTALFGHSMVDAHIYKNHEDALKEQCDRVPKARPTITIDHTIATLQDVRQLVIDRTPWSELKQLFRLHDYESHPAIYMKAAI